MTITIEFSLKEIPDKLENKVDNLSENVNLRGDVKALQTEVSGLDQRIGNQECYHRCFSQCLIYQSPEAIFSPTFQVMYSAKVAQQNGLVLSGFVPRQATVGPTYKLVTAEGI